MDSLWLETILKKHERDHMIEKVVHLDLATATPDGKNYTSVITRGKLDVILGSGRRSKKSVIIKQRISDAIDVIVQSPVFRNETKVYKDVLSRMEDLMDEFNDKRETLWCRFYGYNPHDMILLEDLSYENYNVSDRTKCLDLKQSTIVLNALGRFHAMSKILLTRRILSEDDVTPFYALSNNWFTKNLFYGGLKQLASSIANSWPSEWKEIAEKVSKDAEIVGEKLKALGTSGDENDFLVLNHGDLWTCNLMFKDNDSGDKHNYVKFIDFQVCHVSSYIWDVIYFAYTSTEPEIRRKNFPFLLKTYWESLESTLKFYGYDGKIPTLDQINKEAERVDYFAYVVLAAYHPAMTHDSKKNFDPNKIVETENCHEAFNEECFASETFRNRVEEDLKNFVNKGVI